MTPRQRVRLALRHQPTDRPPIDLGASPVSGIAAGTLARLRLALGLAGSVRVHEPLQLLGDVDDDLRQKLGIDTVGLWSPSTIFGYRNTGRWKPWQLQDGTHVLVSDEFETTTQPNGDVLIYPQGNRSAEPSGRLPRGGFYFDALVRQQPIDEDNLRPEDWFDQFGRFSDSDLDYFQRRAQELYRDTPYSIVGLFGGGGLGDIALVPGEMLLNPLGVRDPETWYEYLITHTPYVRAIFERQTQVALENLELYRQAVGDRIDVLFMSGTDFGTQRSLMISPDLFRDLWKPFYRQLNDWVHQHTPWKIFYHSCGAIADILEDLVDCGVDIINPVQCSAQGMDPQTLKTRYRQRLVFWGGGVDPQPTLQFGTAQEVRRQVAQRCSVLGQGGGYVFNTIHNIQQGVPVENLLAMYEQVSGQPLT